MRVSQPPLASTYRIGGFTCCAHSVLQPVADATVQGLQETLRRHRGIAISNDDQVIKHPAVYE